MVDPLRLPELRLLGGFRLRIGGDEVGLPAPARRLLSYLALHPQSLARSVVAGTLWPETTDEKAGRNLRTTIWRLNTLGITVVHATPTTLALAGDVQVDAHHLDAVAVVTRDPDFDPRLIDIAAITGELLPELWEPWLVFERERLRQVALHTLERLSRRLTALGAHGDAVLAALAAVNTEPLRETANRTLVEAHLAEGNRCEAVRQYRRYAELLLAELGVRPQPSFRCLLTPSLEGSSATP